ncbi:GLPGLI family protein [Lishizhenia sp.]|uniref:GLPGLI family protein n=1 Tax=Lishizhenia sp. TaxID=2497594 RepID=UPI00299E5D31|nr:GLPGLI family protein [Lishizhenia sp.]MDX1445677.1 GLPGLI family protein [Lishizhenia sp.]
MSNGIIKKGLLIALILCAFGSIAQSYQTEGRVYFERKTNLEKKFKGSDSPWTRRIKVKDKIDKFELFFTDSTSLFRPIESDIPDELSWATSKNKVYQNFNTGERITLMSFWSGDLPIEDSIKVREWKMTTSERKIAGYDCRKVFWQVNDSLRIYAWYAEEIPVSTGPESFNGLPGLILGLATEDGGVVYFAREVEFKKVEVEAKIPEYKKKEVKSEEEMLKFLLDNFARDAYMKASLQNMFIW